MATGDKLIQVQHLEKHYNHGAIKALDDVSVDINLKQWRSYGTKTAKVEQPSTDTGKQTVTVEKERDASTAPSAKTYTVKKGDTLWAISAKYYGAGAQYTKIYGANTDKISNPNLIYPGQVLTIP